MARRAQVFRRQPFCARCQERPSVIADHVVPLEDGGLDAVENMQGLCKDCHDQKTAAEQRARLASRAWR